jgi:hypothetical protein
VATGQASLHLQNVDLAMVADVFHLSGLVGPREGACRRRRNSRLASSGVGSCSRRVGVVSCGMVYARV